MIPVLLAGRKSVPREFVLFSHPLRLLETPSTTYVHPQPTLPDRAKIMDPETTIAPLHHTSGEAMFPLLQAYIALRLALEGAKDG